MLVDLATMPIVADTTFVAKWREEMTINGLSSFYVFKQGDSWSYDLSQHINSQVGIRSLQIIDPLNDTRNNPVAGLTIQGTIWTGVNNAKKGQSNRRLKVENLSGETKISSIFQFHSITPTTGVISKSLGNPVTADEIYDRVTVS